MQEYFPIVKKYAEEIGLPLEVAVFGIIESGYVADALSHKGARGIWQLMPLTAKIYDLRMNSYIDERMDVEKSTRAAFLYIKSLSEMFNKNWALILASYNGGGGYISNQIRKHKESDFWKLCQITGFKSETLEFVPRFYAVLHILKNPSAYQLEFPKFNSKIRFDRIKVPRNLKFSLLSKYTSIPEHILEELNPHLKKSIALKNSHLFVPSNMGKMVKSKIKAYWKQKRYVANKKQARRSRYKIVRYRIKTQDTLSEIARRYGTSTSKILRYNRGRIKSASRIYKGMVIRVPVKKGYQVKKRRNRTIVYTVKNGDTLYKIARQYQVSVETLKQANSLRNHVIYKGQTIRIPLSRTGYSRATHRKKKSWTVYRVKSGDTLSGIARKYRVSVREIKKKNGLSGNMIRKGQEIRIPQEVIVYKVRKGDTLSELAQKFQISIRKIVSMNDLSSRQMLAAGRTLLIPGES
jgi:membrane-bound lytic murein transglycosylase D